MHLEARLAVRIRSRYSARRCQLGFERPPRLQNMRGFSGKQQHGLRLRLALHESVKEDRNKILAKSRDQMARGEGQRDVSDRGKISA